MSAVLTNLFGYRTTVKLKSGIINGGEKRSMPSKFSPKGAESTISATIAKIAALYYAAEIGKPSSVVYNSDESHFLTASVVINKEELVFSEIRAEEDLFDLCIYNQSTGSIKAGTLDRDRDVISKFICGYGKRNGSVLLLSMFPRILLDPEAENLYHQLIYDTEFLQEGIVSEEAKDYLAALSDNVYYRIKNNTLHIGGLDTTADTFEPSYIQKTSIDAGAYTAKAGDTIIGTPQIFVMNIEAGSYTPDLSVKMLGDKFFFGTKLKPYEEALVPRLKDNLIVPSYVVRTLKLIKGYSGEERHSRNILYYGEAGSGKSLSSQMVAKGLNKPYLVFSCSPNTSELDLLGQIIPKVGGASEKMMGLLKQLHNLPTMEDLRFDLMGSFKRLTGKEMPKDMAVQDVSALVDKKRNYIIKQIASAGSDGNDFEFVPSPIIQAITNGWVVEIQEIANIKDAGALTVLNQLLEISTGGSHRLITGETITRHPEAVVICTTNVEYAGCRAINQSVLDRMNYTKEIMAPSADQLIDIVAINTKCTNKTFIRQCIVVMNKIREYLSDAGIDDGIVGVRSVIDWVDNVMKLGDVKEGAKETIVSKATFDTDVQKYLYDEYIDKTDFVDVLTFEDIEKSK